MVHVKSFNSWKALGYSIKKGSKAIWFNSDNEPMFSNDQVQKNDKFEYELDAQEDADFGSAMGIDW